MEMDMTNDFEADVLVCGAGAAGLTLAIELARRGVSFRLIEKLDDPFRGSRGKGIQPRTQEVFEDLDILDRIVAVGGFYPKQREYRVDGSYTDTDVMEAEPATPAEPYHLPLMVPQFLTEHVMRERLAELGHRPEFATELVGFEEDADGVTARLSTQLGSETIRVRWLVGADGGRSFVRHTLAIVFPGKTLGVRAIVADVTLSGLSRQVWHRFAEGDMQRQISVCPLAGTDLFQLQGPVPLEGEIDLSPDGLSELLAERTGRSDIVVHGVSWASAFTMNARLADRYRMGRIFLAGDAAHTYPPTGGQGLNTGVQDAYNLGWKLAAVISGAPTALLDSYEEERRPVAQAMLGIATGLLDAMKRGEMRRGRDVHQLDIGYPETSLTLEKPERAGGVLAGDRAPDAPMLGAAGQAIRLFDLLRGPHWTLIVYAGAPDCVGPRAGLQVHAIGPQRELIDKAGHFQAAYAPRTGDCFLIRPDGYIGAIVGAGETAALEAYLAAVGLDGKGSARP
jgi:2-polyprenyl-6-methoxyphenol hydroxylase-like FAD-dependent oxidoreductase